MKSTKNSQWYIIGFIGGHLEICKLTPLSGSDLWRLFWNPPCPAESLKTIKPFDAIFWGPVIFDHRLTRLSCLHYLLPDKRDPSVTDRLQHPRNFETLKSRTANF